MKFFSLFINYI